MMPPSLHAMLVERCRREGVERQPRRRPARLATDGTVLRNYVVAEAGNFKTPDRGQFDATSLHQIVKLMIAAPSGSRAGLGIRVSRTMPLARFSAGPRIREWRTGRCRADLHLPAAKLSPLGDLARLHHGAGAR